MILIADSGSTKTTWCVVHNKENIEKCTTPGINPFLQSEKDISDTLEAAFTLQKGKFGAIHFYGAGCANQEKNEKIRKQLDLFFDAGNIFVDSDLMAAARSLCGKKPGIAAILGTGSNSCYFDGSKIARHVSPLGFILGDEGSGTVLGRKLLADILKNQLPEDICRRFFNTYEVKPAEILDHVYRKPFPNTYMAKFTYFLADNIKDQSIHKLVKESFSEFFSRNVSQFPEAADMPVNFTGSIGWHFREILAEAAKDTGFIMGKITRDPMEGLLEYHINL